MLTRSIGLYSRLVRLMSQRTTGHAKSLVSACVLRISALATCSHTSLVRSGSRLDSRCCAARADRSVQWLPDAEGRQRRA
ncbi:hypothetical protein BV25DRAFT_789042 [Artomyces pyxidatus]|uniref:Uncharacterized protein n=1 Tax=Artomyces pyxidatus TaxID=48021 RepID=A0ACB8SY77_9AGAM|nr:hypothetical protein BV25DRAFT_789042 [Artomyces pyxidatus]